LIRARISANESSPAAGTRTIATADIQYQTSFGSYSPDLTSLETPKTGCGNKTFCAIENGVVHQDITGAALTTGAVCVAYRRLETKFVIRLSLAGTWGRVQSREAPEEILAFFFSNEHSPFNNFIGNVDCSRVAYFR